MVEVFDFEGSMIEPIERFFRGFGAVQTPYFHVSRSSSKLFKALKMLRDLKN
jgi:phosphatidate phosphatase APP1